ncbi:hypothetical protein EV361DRAFT_866598 [Lentinula raphanica]|nr:hypothetical protein EV361DRAFT_866598 [Lentinula raphanica]
MSDTIEDPSALKVTSSDTETPPKIPNHVHITRISPEVFAIPADRVGDPTEHIAAQQVSQFCDYDRAIRKDRWDVDRYLVGYDRFAEVFNQTTKSRYRFAYFRKRASDGFVDRILHLDVEGPPKELFGVEPYQCFGQGVYNHPGFVEIPKRDYEQLREITFDYATRMTSGSYQIWDNSD